MRKISKLILVVVVTGCLLGFMNKALCMTERNIDSFIAKIDKSFESPQNKDEVEKLNQKIQNIKGDAEIIRAIMESSCGSMDVRTINYLIKNLEDYPLVKKLFYLAVSKNIADVDTYNYFIPLVTKKDECDFVAADIFWNTMENNIANSETYIAYIVSYIDRRFSDESSAIGSDQEYYHFGRAKILVDKAKKKNMPDFNSIYSASIDALVDVGCIQSAYDLFVEYHPNYQFTFLNQYMAYDLHGLCFGDAYVLIDLLIRDMKGRGMGEIAIVGNRSNEQELSDLEAAVELFVERDNTVQVEKWHNDQEEIFVFTLVGRLLTNTSQPAKNVRCAGAMPPAA